MEAILASPLDTVLQHPVLIQNGIISFLITVALDVVVAWALYELYKNHPLSGLSTLFRMMHAVIMGVAVFALPLVFKLTTNDEILEQINLFNTIWLIGLFFFGIHLIILGKILEKQKLIAYFLVIAGIMYMIDTIAHFTLPNYQAYSSFFLTLVAIPSIVGEMYLAIWLIAKGGKK